MLLNPARNCICADSGDTFPSMLSWLNRLFGKSGEDGALGERGENIAARYLRDKGFTIIIRNYRCPIGEIDIVAKEGLTIVFVEVKTREEDEPRPEDQVNSAKQHQLTRVARHYLGRYGHPQPPARFDVVAIVWPPGRQPIIRHTPHAFEATF
ncbi:MAG: YraN family protein [Tepidisphaeraceae bacterium]|jgi:putative endonuclease